MLGNFASIEKLSVVQFNTLTNHLQLYFIK